ncbi:hypothetical protein NSU_1524 [Novosphingobium pentaromativorans US6-1]|uniref:Uncharacterized protein n=1 Tax=Novosphingobium pentaromativorans US6-1 TaxID=1088721 RepID=G6EB03_9SPHN|nr:hypothetical protein NSU_1524 [Novosphingobium pentaromativorans US6-1]
MAVPAAATCLSRSARGVPTTRDRRKGEGQSIVERFAQSA